MTNFVSQLNNSVRNFHNDEEGIETLQVIMILAIAAVAAVAVFTLGGYIKDWAEDALDEIIGWEL